MILPWAGLARLIGRAGGASCFACSHKKLQACENTGFHQYTNVPYGPLIVSFFDECLATFPMTLASTLYCLEM